jgi:hypothetical protein
LLLRLSVLGLPIGSSLLKRRPCNSVDCRAAPASPANCSDGSALPRAHSFVARGELPALTDYGAPGLGAGGAVEIYPAGLAVVYLDKLSLPQHCPSSHGRSAVNVAPKAHLRRFGRNNSQASKTRLRVVAYLLALLSSRRLWPAPMTAPLAAFPPMAPIAAPFAAPLALGWDVCGWLCVAAGGVAAGGAPVVAG